MLFLFIIYVFYDHMNYIMGIKKSTAFKTTSVQHECKVQVIKLML